MGVDITLYGHLTYDTIFEDFTEIHSVGSIGNVWTQLLQLNPNLNIRVEPTAIGEALIMSNKEKSIRASTANLNLKTKEPDIQPSKWNHVLYINELPDISFIEHLDGIVSADICKGEPVNLDILEYIDYLFISDEDMHVSIDELSKRTKGYVILHRKTGSFCIHNHVSFATKAEVVDNVNVLGAGDMFAAYVINSLLVSAKNLDKIIEEAHAHLTYHFKSK